MGDPASFLAGVELLDPDMEDEDIILPPVASTASPSAPEAGEVGPAEANGEGFSFGIEVGNGEKSAEVDQQGPGEDEEGEVTEEEAGECHTQP